VSPLRAALYGAVLVVGGLVSFGVPHRIHRWAVFLTALIVYPAVARACQLSARRWRTRYTVLSIAAMCACLTAFIVVHGNHQFAGFDCSLLVDVGWRLVQGQVPYRDFVCNLSPGFMLGVKYAYQLFGVQWNAVLYADAIFASVSFVWIYFLLGGLLSQRLTAFLVAFSVVCAGVLPISYWWYNSLSSVTAAIYFLSCLSYLRLPNSRAAQVSYAASLILLGTLKPNTAAPLAAGSILLLLAMPAGAGKAAVAPGSVRQHSRVRVVVLVALSAGCVLLLMIWNDISPVGLIKAYRAAAAARGISTFGWQMLQTSDRVRTGLYVAALLAPGLLLWGPFHRALRVRDRASLCGYVLLLLAAAVGVFAMVTNGEMKDTDFPLLICFGALLIWGVQFEPGRLGGGAAAAPISRVLSARLFGAFLCGLAVSDVYLGIARARIEYAAHEFFEWTDTERSPGVPYFRSMRASARMEHVVAEISQVIREGQGPVFFGPALEFSYAAFGLPSPKHLPIWWHAGTSYAAADEPALLEAWQRNGFGTLVYLRHALSTPASFRQTIHAEYVEDDRWPDLIVFHARPAAQASMR